MTTLNGRRKLFGLLHPAIPSRVTAGIRKRDYYLVTATITGLVLAEGLMAAVLSDTLSLTALVLVLVESSNTLG